MKTSSRITTVATIAGAVIVGFGAAIAVASAATVSQAAPSLRHTAEAVVRLDPVAVTVSRRYFDAVRAEQPTVARTSESKKVARG